MTAPGRLASLDAFRGLAIAGMILVNNPGSWAHVYPPLRHAVWHGATPTDLVFPFFLFAIGVAMPFSFAAREARGDSRARLWRHVAIRALILYGLGLFMTAVPRFDFATVRLVGVLARIAMVYLAAGTLVLFLSRRAVFALMLAFLFVYWALMALVPVPGFGAGDLSAEGNLAAWLDRMILGPHMWSGGRGVYDPEGLLSTLPAVSSTLAGLFAGDFLRRGQVYGGMRQAEAPPPAKQAGASLRLALLGVLLVGAGHLWDLVFPINKPIWTSSYVVYTTGWALVTLGALHWLIDVRRWRAWARPLEIYGMNAITAFVASGLLAKTLILWRVPDGSGGTTSAYHFVYETGFASWAGPLNGSLAFAAATVLFWFAVAWAMYSRRIFIKV
ncbi:MAG: DUF5009 domain-containing protein [Gemmatimonadota bacterium]|nr:DUF5009 domain-containing protein [Gemmatimonadota bacterium]MDE2677575.1 DUF5009 domain-containing protein [Gemmatimonadota bacterium]